MWGDHLLASLIRLHHIYYPVHTVLAFLFLHLPQNDTIPQILRMRNRRHIFLHREACCRCSFCQHRSGFCNYGTDRLKSWISVNAMFDIFFFIRKLKEKKSSYKLRCFRRISRPEKSREILFKHAYNITIIFTLFNITISWIRSIQGRMSRFSRITAAKIKRKVRISNRQCHSKFPRRGSKTKYEKKNLKLGPRPG